MNPVISEKREYKRSLCKKLGLKTFKQLRKWRKKETKKKSEEVIRLSKLPGDSISFTEIFKMIEEKRSGELNQ